MIQIHNKNNYRRSYRSCSVKDSPEINIKTLDINLYIIYICLFNINESVAKFR